MRVLLINDSIGTGSVGKIVHSIYKGAIDHGHDCRIVLGRTNTTDIPAEKLIKIGNRFSVLIDGFLTRFFGNSGRHSFFSTKKALSRIIEYKPDLINIHSFYGYYINAPLVMKYAKSRNIPVVLTLHSCWDFTGHCCYFSLNGCNSWKNGCKKCKFVRKTYPRALLFDRTHSNYTLKENMYSSGISVVSPSMWMLQLAKESLLRGSDFYVIKNGINQDVFKRIICDKFPSPTVLCVANVWDERKGLKDVIRLADYLGSTATVIVVGLNKKQLNSIPKTIVGLQRTSGVDELVELYNKSTIFFNPTYEDNYPTVNLEAQACGLPVVTYNSGGSSETIINEEFGISVEPGDFESVKAFLNKQAEKKNITTQCLSKLSDKRMANEYIALFEKLISKK